MKKYKNVLDIVLLIGMGSLTLLAIAPETIFMPNSMQMVLLAAVLSLLAVFMILLWRENPADEREAYNQATASRMAYLTGAAVLIVGLIVQNLAHSSDPFVAIALFAMIATKVAVQHRKDG